jgi:hypothetical protein
MVDMPSIYDHTNPERPLEKVSPLKEFLKSCLALMKYETALNALCIMIYHCMKEREFHTMQRVLNQVLHKKRTSDEFRLSARIVDYEMDQVILDVNFLSK